MRRSAFLGLPPRVSRPRRSMARLCMAQSRHVGPDFARRGSFRGAVCNRRFGRAVTTFALLAILVAADWPGSAEFGPYGRAGLATLIALVLFALPPLITNAYVGVTEVDDDVIESAYGMGMSQGKVFSTVELPLAMPVILTGVRLALVQVWATATIAALVAGPGLGRIITRGFANHRTDEVVAGALLVAVGALVLEGLAVLLERYADPMRRARRRTATQELSQPEAVV